MTGDDVKAIRQALELRLGRTISRADLGRALGLEPSNAYTAARKWERDGPTGPAAIALTLFREITDLAEMGFTLAARGDLERYVVSLLTERAARHPNGQPMFATDGTMLDEHGRRPIFDDVDK